MIYKWATVEVYWVLFLVALKFLLIIWDIDKLKTSNMMKTWNSFAFSEVGVLIKGFYVTLIYLSQLYDPSIYSLLRTQLALAVEFFLLKPGYENNFDVVNNQWC